MTAKQLSVFIENRKGRLEEVLDVIKKNGVSIVSLSLADTTEYGLLRLIVNNPEKAQESLKKEGFSTMLTNVLIVNITNEVGSLQKLLVFLSENDINIEYMYGLTIQGSMASIVLKTSNPEKAQDILKSHGIATLTSEEVSKL